jgi:hypothetical protein
MLRPPAVEQLVGPLVEATTGAIESAASPAVGA